MKNNVMEVLIVNIVSVAIENILLTIIFNQNI